jgi:hypothetical protein
MNIFGRKYHLWNVADNRTTKDHIKKLSSRIDRLETLITELVEVMDLVIVIEDFDTEYCSLKKVSKE